MPIVYEELRRLARRALDGRRPGATLETTALVHEAYLRLVDQTRTRWQSRTHFFAIAARAMRRVVVDHARRRLADKRGGGNFELALEDAGDIAQAVDPDVVAIDDALSALEAVDPDLARLVELRFFAGLTLDETAAARGVSTATVEREWATARAWLHRELGRGRGAP